MVMALSSCAVINSVRDFFGNIFNPKVDLADAPLSGDMLIDFANGANPDVLFESDGWSNGDVFNVVWKKHNVIYENGIMKLGITEEKATAWLNDVEVEFNYTAGEARTQNYYHYGDFEVSMKPSANPGTASTFFTCTGPYDTKFVLDENGDYVLDENGQRVSVENPHDEIDIEFLGTDTTHVQFNFFVDGVGGNEYMHDLGFDASEGFHTYGYRWTPSAIVWFVDGEPVYMVTTDTSVKEAGNVRIVEKLPSTPGRILTNYWCGNKKAEGWMGIYNGATKDQGTEYQWIKTSSIGAPLNPEEKPSEEIVGIDWSKIEAITPAFGTTELYTVETEGTSANITYTEVGGSCYKNVEMDITEAAKGKNYLHLVVANNGTSDIRFRVNVVDQALVETGAKNMSTNDSATVNGDTAWTDHEWGGSFFDLAAGQTYEIVIVFKGEVEKLQLMPDSSKNDSSVNAGSITVSEIKFTTVGEVEIPEEPTPNLPGTDPVVPPVGEGLSFNFWVSDGSLYQTSGNNIKYNGTGSTYACAGADISDVAAGKDTFTVTITNNGSADSKVRFDIQATDTVGNHNVCNTGATGGDVWTNMEWGGSTVTVPAGETVTIVITYDENTNRGAVTNLVIFLDSARGDGDTYNSDITLSGMTFYGEGGEDSVDPPAGDEDPVVSPSLGLAFVSDSYTLDFENVVTDTLNVSYSNIQGGTYQNICSQVQDIANDYSKFTVTIKNNGDATVRVRIDLKGTNTVGNTDICNTEIIGGEWTDLEWGGSFVNVAAGEEITVTVCYNTNHGEGKDFGSVIELLIYFDTSTYQDSNTYSGNLTLSAFSFSN
ncbi:MAG: family 16 glycosylhydrolase [Clostridia bacterium]|nr:family 16 glycosylhydrolase [Clostridia bacterium]